MTCQHDYIITFRTPDGQPVMWACSDCKLKFVPFSQMLTEVAEEREACARLCETEFISDSAESCAAAIRWRGEK